MNLALLAAAATGVQVGAAIVASRRVVRGAATYTGHAALRLKHESPTRVTIFLALNPVTAAVLGALLLHEAFDLWRLGAIVLIAAGLWLATRTGTTGAQR